MSSQVIAPLLAEAIDAVSVAQSRSGRLLLLALAAMALSMEAVILVTGVWPNIGSARPDEGCRYWTGVSLVHRAGVDPSRCPLYIGRR